MSERVHVRVRVSVSESVSVSVSVCARVRVSRTHEHTHTCPPPTLAHRDTTALEQVRSDGEQLRVLECGHVDVQQ